MLKKNIFGFMQFVIILIFMSQPSKISALEITFQEFLNLLEYPLMYNPERNELMIDLFAYNPGTYVVSQEKESVYKHTLVSKEIQYKEDRTNSEYRKTFKKYMSWKKELYENGVI